MLVIIVGIVIDWFGYGYAACEAEDWIFSVDCDEWFGYVCVAREA